VTRDDIVEWTRQAGGFNATPEFLARFAALVAAHEREECAKAAEAFHHHAYDFTGNLELHEFIRARGQA
jgi:hypothetical protein